MKQEEMSDISTILIEATDERSAVMEQVSKQTRPVIIVLLEQADQIFRQPGDFFELKRLKRERGLSIALVISGHERIRNMARRQGFQVYTSAETCVRAMARRDRLYTMRGISLSGTLPAGTDLSCPPSGFMGGSEDTINRSLRGVSGTDQARFIAQGDESDDDVPWSYDVPMSQETAFTASVPNNAEARFIASALHHNEEAAMRGEDQSDDAPPWSYGVEMNQVRPATEMAQNIRMQADESSDEDVPWSYDVPTNQTSTPAEKHPQRTAWMLTEEELWSQKHQPLIQNEYYGQLYAGQQFAGHPQGVPVDRGPIPRSPYTNQYLPEFLNSAPAGETPIPPSFTETLDNLVALSGEKLGQHHPYMASGGWGPDQRAPLASAHTDALQAGASRGVLRTGVPLYIPDTEPLHPVTETRPLTKSEQAGSRLVLVLTALLILSILGGVCFGYALTLMHVNLTILTSIRSL